MHEPEASDKQESKRSNARMSIEETMAAAEAHRETWQRLRWLMADAKRENWSYEVLCERVTEEIVSLAEEFAAPI